MKYAIIALTVWCAFGTINLSASTPATVDARQLFIPLAPSEKANTTQGSAFDKILMLQHNAAEQLLGKAPSEISLTHFDVPLHGDVTLALKRTADVYDANSEFWVSTPNGKRRITVRPIVSFRGIVEGDPQSVVSLHYSQGDLTGYIFHSDGSRTTIGRDWDNRAIDGATPHFVSDANASGLSEMLSQFICGNESLPVDEGEVVRAMQMPSSLNGKGESMQSLPLKEIRMAIVLREEVDAELKTRGYTDEMVAMHFAKIVAAMSQAYEEDLRTRMYIGYFLAHTNEAPSGYLYDGSEPRELLNEFSQDWSGGYASVNRTLAHLYTKKRPSGGTYVGGIAYGGQSGSRLCNKNHQGGYGVSTIDVTATSNIPGRPANRNAYVWDVFVATHEIGHNVGSPHTHNCYWSPPVDTCQVKSDSTDACYDNPALRRPRPGTIMSYCHLVNGSSTPLTFGMRVAERMRTWVDGASCVAEPANAMVSITSPRGSESWTPGANVTIKWVSARVSSINLDYSINGGTSWNEITNNKPAVDSQYVWTLPSVSSTELWIRISDATNVSVNNVSIAPYTIIVPLEVKVPIGGERLARGSIFSVRWTNQGAGSVHLQFAPDGIAFTNIASNLPSATTTFDWTVADVETSNARIRVVSAGNNTISSTSNPFVIGTSRFRLLLPNDGTVICSDVATQYNWDGDFIDRIKIQYSTDNGSSWKNAIQSLTVPVQQWEIFSRNNSLSNVPNGTAALLRVIDNASDTVLDTRSTMTIDTCGVVTGYTEEFGSPSGFAIESISPNPASTNVDVRLTHSSGAQAEILLIDVTGQAISVMRTDVTNSGTTTLSIPLGGVALSSGTYRLVVKSGSASVSAPLSIVR